MKRGWRAGAASSALLRWVAATRRGAPKIIERELTELEGARPFRLP